jgi:hypothetical protein
MTPESSSERRPWAIPPGALSEWLALAAVLEEVGTVPCRTSDAEAWWPDRRDMDAPSTRMAVRACWACPARTVCLSYAVAADERSGVWGGLLPRGATSQPGGSLNWQI